MDKCVPIILSVGKIFSIFTKQSKKEQKTKQQTEKDANLEE